MCVLGCVCVCVCVYVRVCACACRSVQEYIYICLGAYVCMYIYICIYIYLYNGPINQRGKGSASGPYIYRTESTHDSRHLFVISTTHIRSKAGTKTKGIRQE